MIIGVIVIIVLLVCILYFYFIPNNSPILFSLQQELDFEKKRLVVSFTSSPKRIEKIKPMIDSIMNQDILPDKIYIHLPKIFKRDNSVFGKIPNFITDNELIQINYTQDIGPITKILPVLEFEKDPNTLVLSVDDDIYYETSLIARFLYYSDIYPNSVLTGTSFLMDSRYCSNPETEFCNKNLADPAHFYSQFLEGYSGVLYKISFLSKFPINNINLLPRECILGDDLLLSNYFKSQNIPIISIETLNLVTPLDYGFDNDALHSTNMENESKNNSNYKKCISWLQKTKQLYLKDIKKNSRYPFLKLL
jgi:hypothetical protein